MSNFRLKSCQGLQATYVETVETCEHNQAVMVVLPYLCLLSLVWVVFPVITNAASQDSWMTASPFSRVQETLDIYQQNDNAGIDGLSVSWKEPENDWKYFNTLSVNQQAPEDIQTTRGKSGRRNDDTQKEMLEQIECQEQAKSGNDLSASCQELMQTEKACTEEGNCLVNTDCCSIPGLPKKECVSKVETSSTLTYEIENVQRREPSLPSEINKLFLDDPKSLQVVVLPVGQGDCIVMRCPKKKLVMFDCGSSDKQGTDSRTKALSAKEVRQAIPGNDIVTIFISHGDIDHYNYLDKVFSDIGNIKHVIIGGHPSQYSTLGIRGWLQNIAEKGNLYAINEYKKCMGAQECNKNLHTISLGKDWQRSSKLTSLSDLNICDTSVTFDIIAANVGSLQTNQKSIVLKVTAGSHSVKQSVLFTGDIDGDAATSIAKGVHEQLKSNVFQLSHHGSAGANDGEWLGAIKPQKEQPQPMEAFVSHAYNSKHGHPHCEVIERLIKMEFIATDTETHPFHCTNGAGKLHNDEMCHRIFSTHPRKDSLCVILFMLGEEPKTTYKCYKP